MWTTDKEGITPALLAAESLRALAAIPGSRIAISSELGEPVADRAEAPAAAEQKSRLAKR